ncbi:hypothetical protein KUTeg_023679 [Tegillarca granosa]|uniref:Uncharacterized protein n=1 Tax=Tegillarca granosa TaxID=220873 RepID=A0ABQ9E2S2_TEGGR|nr:hypothetical protein KUTeg_023679 [Tegillarca granosa]
MDFIGKTKHFLNVFMINMHFNNPDKFLIFIIYIIIQFFKIKFHLNLIQIVPCIVLSIISVNNVSGIRIIYKIFFYVQIIPNYFVLLKFYTCFIIAKNTITKNHIPLFGTQLPKITYPLFVFDIILDMAFNRKGIEHFEKTCMPQNFMEKCLLCDFLFNGNNFLLKILYYIGNTLYNKEDGFSTRELEHYSH